eukprot:scaffold20352_cov28-Tisochrysis_lutea.AAC.8
MLSRVVETLRSASASRTVLKRSVSHHVPHSGRPLPLDSPPSPLDWRTARSTASHKTLSTSGCSLKGVTTAKG